MEWDMGKLYTMVCSYLFRRMLVSHQDLFVMYHRRIMHMYLCYAASVICMGHQKVQEIIASKAMKSGTHQKMPAQQQNHPLEQNAQQIASVKL